MGEEHVHEVAGAGLYPDPAHPLPGHTLPVKQVNKRVTVTMHIVHSEGLLKIYIESCEHTKFLDIKVMLVCVSDTVIAS